MGIRRSRHKANLNHFNVVQRMVESHVASRVNGSRIPKYVIKNVIDYLDKQLDNEVLSVDEVDALTNYFEALNSENRLTQEAYNGLLTVAAGEYAKVFITVDLKKPADEYLIKFKNTLMGVIDQDGKYFDKLTSSLEESARLIQQFGADENSPRLIRIKLLLEEINRVRKISGLDLRESILTKPKGFFEGGYFEALTTAKERSSFEAIKKDTHSFYNKAFNAILNESEFALDYLALLASTDKIYLIGKILDNINVSYSAHSSHLKLASVVIDKVARALVDNPLVAEKDPKMLDAVFKNSCPTIVYRLLAIDALDAETIWNKYVFIKLRDETNVRASKLTKSFVLEKMLNEWPYLGDMDLLDPAPKIDALQLG